MNLLLDIKYSLRILLKTPAFTALTIAVMTVGLGVSIFMMSIVNTNHFNLLSIKLYQLANNFFIATKIVLP